MILLEGPDACGKGSVAKALKSILHGWSYRHHTKPPIPCTYTYFSWFTADTHPSVVVDRLHWSAVCYGMTYRHQEELTYHQWRLLELHLMARATVTLYMTDKPENIVGRWDQAREMFNPEPIHKLVNLYEGLFAGGYLGVRAFRTFLPRERFTLPELVSSNGEPTKRLVRIARQATWEANKSYSLHPASIGMGSTRARFMIVGEIPGNPDPNSMVPQSPFDFGHSANVLWSWFDEVGLRWWEGYYTNASAFPTQEHLKQYCSLFSDLELVLCLGNTAHDLVKEAFGCDKDAPRIRGLYHPSYLRRLPQSEQHKWSLELKQILQVYCTDGLAQIEDTDKWKLLLL